MVPKNRAIVDIFRKWYSKTQINMVISQIVHPQSKHYTKFVDLKKSF